jgi:hypothetical protein
MSDSPGAGRGTIVLSPFSAEQVLRLNSYQMAAPAHPFTCLLDHPDRRLVATLKGWVCPHCPYKQQWAHAFMVSWPEGWTRLTAATTWTGPGRD